VVEESPAEDNWTQLGRPLCVRYELGLYVTSYSKTYVICFLDKMAAAVCCCDTSHVYGTLRTKGPNSKFMLIGKCKNKSLYRVIYDI
jgi:hypothetical protein